MLRAMRIQFVDILRLFAGTVCTALIVISCASTAVTAFVLPPPNRPWPTPPLPPYIIDGTPSEPCKWPWHVALLKADRTFFCGATLISSKWILTAAHCLYGKPPFVPIYAALGAYNLSAHDEHQLIPVIMITIHRFYDPDSYGVNDLALLELTQLANLSDPCIKPIDFPPQDFEPMNSDNCWMIGWGKYSHDSTSWSEIPLEAETSVISNDECQRRWEMSLFFRPDINTNNVCTYDRKNYTSACEKDSGSPLQCFDNSGAGRWVLVGIQSWGSAGCKIYPSVFMRVSNYTPWILVNVIPERDQALTTSVPVY